MHAFHRILSSKTYLKFQNEIELLVFDLVAFHTALYMLLDKNSITKEWVFCSQSKNQIWNVIDAKSSHTLIFFFSLSNSHSSICGFWWSGVLWKLEVWEVIVSNSKSQLPQLLPSNYFHAIVVRLVHMDNSFSFNIFHSHLMDFDWS